MKYALLSVYDKTGIVDLAKVLIKRGYKLIATGGTLEALKNLGVVPIEDITGNPRDSFDGRIKTISFQIASGILFDRQNPKHVIEAKKLKIPQIDIVVCNLYPAANIDVGGPTMIRAAAKNYQNCTVLVDPKDYGNLDMALQSKKIRKNLAAKAFYHLSLYDSEIGQFLNMQDFPDELTIPLRKIKDLRYGENPHQKGSLYALPNTSSSLTKLEHLWGRDLSGTNSGDIFTGIETVRQFNEPAAAVIKHLSPCGIALGSDAREALERAVEADPVSAFGGVVVLNTKMDEEAAQVIGHMDIVAVPAISQKGLQQLKKIRKSMGIYTFGNIPERREKWDLRWFGGAMLLQDFDDYPEDSFKNWETVTRKKPNNEQIKLMQFGFKAAKAVRSNAVLVVDGKIPMTRGIGSGQTSRIGATKIALEQSDKFAKSGILISDSFFPFDDCVRLAAKYGIAAILEQGGSLNDKLSIKAADELGIVMIFTGRRAFRH